ncbi:hypothetical protein K504DRAFT_497310 [Pleomassaria siparia CBS 279.74]|uniref:Uncharacterized protein n=1 Tax=Pleomassaria siparia CBS 279.74 TaxID=1314801 RepID=A0A6G1KSY7_9PLEO|nr:hypothetical protein K504DRAFT_497310 [Pleomassaria siparia CBS 279.74]
MSFSYDRYDRRQPPSSRRTTFGYWVPLIFTVTVATAGVVAWVWSERRDDEDESDDADLSYGEDGKIPGRYNSSSSMSQGVVREDEGLVSRMHGVLRRTPSPQQLFDTVSKKTVAGVAAASAAAGAALASIREEDRDDFGDHSRWSEEATLRRQVQAQSSQSAAAVDTQTKSFAASVRGGPQHIGRRKTVAIVVSAESLMDNPHEDDATYRSENATILSHLPDTDFSKTKLFVLVYSPSLRSRPNSRTGAASLGSSYSAISAPGDDLRTLEPHPEETIYTPALSTRSSDNVLWNTLHAQALRLVEKSAMLMPFTTPTGHVHMLKHLGPDLVYIVDALSGHEGSNVKEVKRWVGQTIVVVSSDGTGLGVLVDTDDEGPASKFKTEHADHASKWWESADMVGLGKGVEVVDASRLEDDFERRVGGRE